MLEGKLGIKPNLEPLKLAKAGILATLHYYNISKTRSKGSDNNILVYIVKSLQ